MNDISKDTRLSSINHALKNQTIKIISVALKNKNNKTALLRHDGTPFLLLCLHCVLRISGILQRILGSTSAQEEKSALRNGSNGGTHCSHIGQGIL